ncbi:DsbA family oxidoreductase [Polynucleobacter antarcticus]|uniref:Disulfide bond formation protein DsbA n=1 Tax=Polynucleobacter antarcticus TaxID=1743162 RepID=A0A6M9PXK5_9BURK|nr:DsbA family oxidoreductase [Polynucleobacter antarcticus]QKM63707.1 disulfide bond formation protein DsbA [Polynucleobacter antarcticus]
MQTKLKIDFVSDVACPWCAVGLGNLTQAIATINDKESIELHFQPFELNPTMPLGGQDAMEHLTQKYGLSEAQVSSNQANIRAKAKEVGFEFHPDGRKRVYNTFNCHRLLYWALQAYGPAAQYRLKRELLRAYFEDVSNMDEAETLLCAVDRSELDRAKALEIINSKLYENEVKLLETHYTDEGISAVPAVILNDQYLISGAQPIEVYQEAIAQALSEASPSE